jgi:hypothetical protein
MLLISNDKTPENVKRMALWAFGETRNDRDVGNYITVTTASIKTSITIDKIPAKAIKFIIIDETFDRAQIKTEIKDIFGRAVDIKDGVLDIVKL